MLYPAPPEKTKAKNVAFLVRTDNTPWMNNSDETGVVDSLTSKPIAELFPTATVLFADIGEFILYPFAHESRAESHPFHIFR